MGIICINNFILSIFKDEVLMITGGTGSCGNAVVKRFIRTDIGGICIFSRDEKKQDDMWHECQVKYPEVAHKIKFYIDDVSRETIDEFNSNNTYRLSLEETNKRIAAWEYIQETLGS